jgi:tetratricopeptide (TPR) repeat protein
MAKGRDQFTGLGFKGFPLVADRDFKGRKAIGVQMGIVEKTKLLIALTLIVGCSHMGVRDTASTYSSEVTQVNNSNPLARTIPEPDENRIDDTYLNTKADYHFTMAESYSLQGEGAKAVENYKLALVYDQDSAQIRYRLALEYVKLGLITEAINLCQESIKLEPTHKDSSLLLGGLYSAMHLFDEALKVYRDNLKNYPDDLETSLFIGALYAEKGEFDKSLTHFKQLARNKNIKDKSQVWYYMGRVYASKPEPDQANAEMAFITSLKLEPDAVDVVLALGALYESQERHKDLQRLFASFQEEHGSHHVIAERLAQSYLDEENFDQALYQLKLVESYDRSNLNVSLKIALIMIEQKQYSEAIAKLETILKTSPDSEKVRFYLGALYEETKNYPAAIQQFETIPFTSSYYEDSIMHAAYLYKLLDQPSTAIKTVKEGLERKSDSAKFWLLYASLLDEEKQLKQAQEALTAAMERFPEDKQIHFQLGSVYDRLGDKNKTIEHMNIVIGIDENHVQALNYLAYVYAEESKNLSVAEELVRRALELQPGDGFILDTLGWVLFKQDRLPEAIQVLEKAHKKESKESIIAEHLGDAYFRHQLPRKAKEMYNKAAQLEKDSKNRAKIQTKIYSIEQKLQADRQERRRTPASVK